MLYNKYQQTDLDTLILFSNIFCLVTGLLQLASSAPVTNIQTNHHCSQITFKKQLNFNDRYKKNDSLRNNEKEACVLLKTNTLIN